MPSPLVIIVATMDTRNLEDCMFTFDAARWMKVALARGVCQQDIMIYAQFAWGVACGMCDDIEEYEHCFGINSADIKLLKKMYVHTPDIHKVGEQLANINYANYSSVALVLLNHGSPDGVFGDCLDGKGLSQVVAHIPRPTVVIASHCFAGVLFKELLAVSRNDVVRIHDDGDSERVAYSWATTVEICGAPAQGGTLLSLVLLRDVFTKSGHDLQRQCTHLNKNPALVGNVPVKVVVEGNTDLLSSVPFFGAGTGSLQFPQNVKIIRALHDNIPHVRPGVHPKLEVIINSLPPPPTFWDDAYNPKTYDTAIAKKNGLQHVIELCQHLRLKGLLDKTYPSGLVCYALVVYELVDAVETELNKL